MNSDQDVIARLRQAQSGEAGPPSDETPPFEFTTVLALGRRHRRRRAIARWAGGAGISVMAVAAAVAISAQLSQPNEGDMVAAATTVAPRTAEPSPTTALAFVPAEIVDSYEGWPRGVNAAPQAQGAFAEPSQGTITVWTTGSTNCPRIPKQIESDGAVLTVIVGMTDHEEPPNGEQFICTADANVVTYVLAIPDQHSADQDLTVKIIREHD